MQNRSLAPTPWRKVGLAILPGLFALAAGSGLLESVFDETLAQTIRQAGLVVLCGLLIIAGLIRERRLPVWCFPAVGMVIPVLGAWWWVPVANMLIPYVEPPAGFWLLAPLPLEFALAAPIAALAAYRVYKEHGIHVPRLGWAVMGLIILLGLAGAITGSIVGAHPYQWAALSVRLWHASWWMALILCPIAIGLPLAWRKGALAGLIVVASQYILVDGLLGCVVAGGQPVEGVCICASYQTTVLVLSLVSSLATLLFLVASPIWVLRTGSAHGRIWGLLMPPLITVVGAESILAIVCRAIPSGYWISWWLTHVLSSAQFVVPVALAAVMYRWIEGQGARAGGQ